MRGEREKGESAKRVSESTHTQIEWSKSMYPHTHTHKKRSFGSEERGPSGPSGLGHTRALFIIT